MRRFRYLKDPLFIFCLSAYFLNRLAIKPYFPNFFSSAYFNDLICIPFWVPIMLLVMRKTGLRRSDGPPVAYEILVPLIIWSYVFEYSAPHTQSLRGLAFGDYLDILFYCLGALIAGVTWKQWYASGSLCENSPHSSS